MSTRDPDRFDRLERALEAWFEIEDEATSTRFDGEDAEVRELVDAMRDAPPDVDARLLRLGDFQLVRELGRGGMGVVYEALDLRLERRVALKVLAAQDAGPGSATRARFLREASAAGRLQHPAICQIFGSGEDDGRLWISMELLRGGTLAENMRVPGGLPGEDEHGRTHAAVALAATLADALDFAHRHDVVHRDVKAQNVLFDELGKPRLVDFGVAKLVDRAALTRTGDFAGSLAYASPEQIAGVREIDGGTDVWSLGVVLYEVLTGARPFAEDKHEALLRAILGRDPVMPATIPHDLRVILGCALEKERKRRYASAGDFAEDLRRFLRHDPIAAAPPSTVSRFTRFVRRRRKALLSGAAACALVGAALWGLSHAARSDSDVDTSVENARSALEELQAMVDTRELATTPREMRARRATIEGVVQRAEQLFALRPDNDALRHTLARTHEKAALLYQRLKQKSPALASHGRAIQLLDAQASQDEGARNTIASSYHNRHVLLRALGRHDEADDDLEKAIEAWTSVFDGAGPLADEARPRLALALTNRARRRTGSDRAGDDLARAEELWREHEADAARARRGADEYAAHRLQTLALLARHASSRREAPRALEVLDELQARQAALPARLRSQIAIASLAAETRQTRASLLFQSGDLDAADREFRAAIRAYAEIARSGTADSRSNLLRARVQHATALDRAKRYDALDSVLGPALREAERLAAEHPYALTWGMHATLLVLRAERTREEDPTASRRLLARAVELERKVGSGHDFVTAAAHARLAQVHADAGEEGEAIALARGAFELLCGRYAENDPNAKSGGLLRYRAQQVLRMLDRSRRVAEMRDIAERLRQTAPDNAELVGVALLALDRAARIQRAPPEERARFRRSAVELATQWIDALEAEGRPWRDAARVSGLRFFQRAPSVGPRLRERKEARGAEAPKKAPTKPPTKGAADNAAENAGREEGGDK